jgi:hypothetical protein
MIFITPIPPTMREMAATHPRKSVRVAVTDEIEERSSEMELMV